MLKKIIAVSVFGVSALAMMTANATVPGIYVIGQAGYANNHLGKKLTDIYHGPLYTGPSSFKLSNTGLAGRLGIGYQFNPYFATELGYLQLANQKGKDDGSTGNYIGTETLKQNAIDITLKGVLPITDKFSAYGKLGAAYLTTTITGGNFIVADDGTAPKGSDNDNEVLKIAKHKWAPEAAVGVSYDITPNMFIDASLTHIQPLGKNKSGNIDFAAVGIGYSFG